MKLRNCILRLCLFAMFVTGLGEVLHVNASENIQEMTRGKQKHFWFPKKNKLKKIPSYYTRVYYRNTCYYYHNGFFYRPLKDVMKDFVHM